MLRHEDRIAELEQVLGLLKGYKGETIVKAEHPLHIAIQALEAKCRTRARPELQDILFKPAHRQWFHLLWACRNDTPNHSASSNEPQGWFQSQANPELAMQWRDILIEELSKWGPDYPSPLP